LLALATLGSLAGLVLTGSRGAWLAVAVAGGAWLAWELSKRQPAQMPPAERRWLWLAVFLAAATAGALLALTLCGPDCRTGAVGRLDLYRDALGLALDTPFSGLGLGGDRFQMAYSSYVLLIHVGYLPHSHNLPVQVLLEQGILGLIALLWITALVVLQRGPFNLWKRRRVPASP
jgi:O-antigen ligase